MTTTSTALDTSAPAPAFFDVAAWAAQTAQPGDYFDEAAAAHAAGFFPRYLRHTKDRWLGKPFELDPDWQLPLIRTIFGWKKPDGTRRFRIVYVEIGRKNGKTGLAAGIGAYMTFAEGTKGAEIYSAANDKDQASICFTEAKRMRAPALLERSHAFKNSMTVPAKWNKFEVLSADSETKDGLNVFCFIYDELHASKDRDLYDVLHTATGARTSPLELLITTAGTDRDSLCYEMHEHAEKVRDAQIEDHEFLPVIYAAGKDDDISDPATWAKANPSLGKTIGVDYLKKEAARALQMPRYMNTFKRLHLDIWTDAVTLWLPLAKWDQCSRGPESVTLEALAGRACFGGLDLSSTTDLTALTLVFPDGVGGFDIYAHFWMPDTWTNGEHDNLTIADRSKVERVPYDQWVKQGFITLTQGNVVDYDVIRAWISGETQLTNVSQPEKIEALRAAALIRQVNLKKLARDRWNATQISTQLMGDGIEVVDFGQGFASMSAPSKQLETLILEGGINHGGNPVLRWMASVVAVKSDPADNIKPVKPDRRKNVARIDGIVAGIMALGLAIAEPPDTAGDLERKILARGGLA